LNPWRSALDADGLDFDPESPSIGLNEDWAPWLRRHFSPYFSRHGKPVGFASFHCELWEWVWSLRIGIRPDPFIAIWSRDAGKSTNAEIGCVALGARRVRRYGLYISSTQDKADDHVSNVGEILENSPVTREDPALTSRRVGKYGQSKGWRRNRLRTASGFTLDALGLDSAARGAKLDEQRPDFIVLDDIDQDGDTELKVQKKIDQLTRKIFPAGASDVAILGVQNLVHANSVFARFVDGRNQFLLNRKVSGPHPALRGLDYLETDGKVQLTAGEATWTGLSFDRCQQIVNDTGITAFLAEYQHDKSAQQGAFFGDAWLESVHVVDPFPVPRQWRVDRSFDYGFAKPFSVGWWAVADGSTAVNGFVFPRGTLFRIHEWYGWNGKPNQGARMLAVDIADKIREIEARIPNLRGRVQPGPADSSIWSGPPSNNVATDMSSRGVQWLPVDKGPGSRINGARLFRERLLASRQHPMTQKGIFFFRTCEQIIRCLPQLPRDPTEPDDVFTDAEDHNYDDARYRIQWRPMPVRSGSTIGLY
jgi:hypothetical protein